jgi:hypothetical protein
MLYTDLAKEDEFNSFNGWIAANPVMWHRIIMSPTCPSKEVVLPGIQTSAWTVMKGAITGKEYRSSDVALAPFFSRQPAQESIKVLMYLYMLGQWNLSRIL